MEMSSENNDFFKGNFQKLLVYKMGIKNDR